ncbi:transposase domain-containing protein [Thalassobaculum sp. OXR-137]|uniref:transposase domain-containing protein n=1 Tax=Thalassobaculum sp. OXR-137 TaxID=3100173 RepID=UPI002AC9EE36|nr:transposase domain-containing protein [Thalassobaculum sp. OXR-137]WPZ33196.1 transposase domain-containing protein [Thalassobaculum sp. OXR-137]
MAKAAIYDACRLDILVLWPDGSIGRPILHALQDPVSGKILATRLDASSRIDQFRPPFGDNAGNFGGAG